MKKFTLIARILLGLVFVVIGGLNGLFHFLPTPPMPEKVTAFFGAMAATGYFLPVVAVCELVGGALLVAGVFVPLGLVILAPLLIQITLFHLFLDRSGLPMAIVMDALEIYLAFFSKAYSPVIRPLFRNAKK
ncbi:MAG: DoxX family membrane protein [Bdellovibrionota bacterium]